MEKTVLRAVLNSIFIIIFNIAFFLIGGFEHKASAWISYGFIHFAYFMMILTPILLRKGKNEAVFRFSLYSISSIYFLAELITGSVFILVAPDSYIAALLLQFIIAGLYGINLISHMIANEQTVEGEEERHYQIAYVKDASAKLKGMLEYVSDKEAKKKVEGVYDAVYSSPVKSDPNLAHMEISILQSINELDAAISEENNEKIISLSDSLITAVNKRNMQLRAIN